MIKYNILYHKSIMSTHYVIISDQINLYYTILNCDESLYALYENISNTKHISNTIQFLNKSSLNNSDMERHIFSKITEYEVELRNDKFNTLLDDYEKLHSL